MNYSLPETYDKENLIPVVIKVTRAGKKNLPKFMRFNQIKNILFIEPDINEIVGFYNILITLTDSLGAKREYPITV